MLILLSFNMTKILESTYPALFKPSKAKPAVIAPSPIIAICCFLKSPFSLDATAIPRAAEMEVEECPTPKVS